MSGVLVRGTDAAMFDRARNFVMTALFGEWTAYAANRAFIAEDGTQIPACEWHWRRWADGGWQRRKMSPDVQHDVNGDAIW